MTERHQSHVGMAVVLAMVVALGPFALDAYLPAFPAIADSLGVNTYEVSLSISIYVLFIAFGQLIGGPLSDRYGRDKITFVGLSVFAVASALITQVASLNELLALRVLQAFGSGCATVCVPALVRDRFSGIEAAKYFSLIGLIMMVAPAVAPSIGSLILSVFGWQHIFSFLCLYAGLTLVLFKRRVVFSGSHSKVVTSAQISVWQRYRAVFSVTPAMKIMLLQSLCFSTMLLFVTHSSYIYQEYFGVSPAVFSMFFAANIVVMLMANLVNRRLLGVFSSMQILRWGVTVQGVGIVSLLTVLCFAPKLWLFLPAMMITIGMMGAIGPNSQACFMEYFAEHGGTASALLGASMFFAGGLISAASSLLPESVLMIVSAQAICSSLCLVLVWSSRKAR